MGSIYSKINISPSTTEKLVIDLADGTKLEYDIENSKLTAQVNGKAEITSTTEFNTRTILTGEYSKDSLKFHVGANKDQSIELTFSDMKPRALGIGKIDLTSQGKANEAIQTLIS